MIKGFGALDVAITLEAACYRLECPSVGKED